MDSQNSFERLVQGISQEERLTLLRKLETINSDPSRQSIDPIVYNDEPFDFKIGLKSESIFVRLWLHLKALFSSSDIDNIYNTYLLSQKAKEIERKYIDILNYKSSVLLSNFYEQLIKLKRCADFFRSGISIFDDDQGAFFVFLGSLILPAIAEDIAKVSNPESIPLDKEITPELRTSLLRKMEDVLQNIPLVERNKIYTSVKAIEWLKHFVNLPFENFISKFITLSPGTYTCPLDSVSSELNEFCKVLCHGVKLTTEVLEALFLFSQKNQEDQQNQGPKDDATLFVERSIEQIAIIKSFIHEIPLKNLTALSMNSSIWVPERPEGAEDWFVKYKAQWRKIFDQKWENWLQSKRKYTVSLKIKKMLNSENLPLLPFRPWTEIWNGIPFSKEYSIGFLYHYSQIVLPKLLKPLKILLIEANFTQRDSRVEYTDVFNELNHLVQNLQDFTTNISPKGVYGTSFENVIKESLRTIQGQAKVDALLHSIEVEATALITQFGNSARSIQIILGGILSDTKETRYISVSNIANIQGVDNGNIREQLQSAKESLIEAHEIIKELEAVELTHGKLH